MANTLLNLYKLYMTLKIQPTLQLDRVSQVAEILEREIIERGLRGGDPFASSQEIGKRFGISKSTANRVLGQLVASKVLVRHRGRGNFIHPDWKFSGVATKSIFVIEAADRVAALPEVVGRLAGWLSLQQPLGVQTLMLPMAQPMASLRATLGGAWARGEVDKVIAVSCPREVYQYLIEQGIPTLVIGSLYSDQDQLVSIDRNARKEGQLLANYLISEGSCKIAVFQPNTVRPGTAAFLDGIQEIADRSRKISLRVRQLPPIESHQLAVLRDTLLQEKPDGIITEGANLASITLAIARSEKIKVPSQLRIAHSTSSIFSGGEKNLPHTQVALSEGAFLENVMEMLGKCSSGPTEHRVIDVQLIVPRNKKQHVH